MLSLSKQEDTWSNFFRKILSRRSAMAGSLATLAIKFAGAGLMISIFLMAARSLSPQDFGQLAVSFNALSFLSIIAILGQDVLLVRSWGLYISGHKYELAHGALKFGYITVSTSIVLFGAAIIFFGWLSNFYYYSLINSIVFASFIVFQITLLFTTQVTRLVVSFIVSEFHREITWRLFLIVTVAIALWTGLTVTGFYAAASAGIAIAIAFQLLALNRRLSIEIRTSQPSMERTAWAKRASDMWASAVLEAASQYVEVLLIGILVSSSDAGVYFIAARIANVFAMMSAGLHSYTVTYSSNLYHAGQISTLQNLFRSVMIMAFAIASPLILILIIFGNQLLSVFGPHYTGAYPIILVLSLGSFTSAMAGPSNGLLLVTGYEKFYSRVLLAAFLLRVALIIILAPTFGALGVAGAWTFVNCPVAIGLAIATRIFTGINPSVFCIIKQLQSSLIKEKKSQTAKD